MERVYVGIEYEFALISNIIYSVMHNMNLLPYSLYYFSFNLKYMYCIKILMLV